MVGGGGGPPIGPAGGGGGPKFPGLGAINPTPIIPGCCGGCCGAGGIIIMRPPTIPPTLGGCAGGGGPKPIPGCGGLRVSLQQ